MPEFGRKIPKFYIPIADGRKVHFVVLADVHIGTRLTAVDRYAELVNYISKKKNYYVFFGGDCCDLLTPMDYRWNHVTVQSIDPKFINSSDIVDAEIEEFAKLTKPIARKFIAMVYGNHEAARQDDGYDPIIPDIINRIKAEQAFYLGANGIVELIFIDPKTEKKIDSKFAYISHYPPKNGSKITSIINGMIEFGRNKDYDIFMYGHLHKKILFNDLITRVKNGREVTIKKLYTMTGTYLTTYDAAGTENYAKIRQFGQPDIGVTKITAIRTGRYISLHGSL